MPSRLYSSVRSSYSPASLREDEHTAKRGSLAASSETEQLALGAVARTWRRPVTVSTRTTWVDEPSDERGKRDCMITLRGSSNSGSSSEKLSKPTDCERWVAPRVPRKMTGVAWLPSALTAYHSPSANGCA